jgi:uncharacterized damage-inducible protein DinB
MEPKVIASSPYLIGRISGFAPEISRLVGMLRYARHTTMKAVQGLSIEQLDYVQDEHSNSIGMLLHHVAAVEVAYQIGTFEQRELTKEELERWSPALDLGAGARQKLSGEALPKHLSRLEAIRAETERQLGTRSDSWLDEETVFANGHSANNYFKWFHVMEDELSHRGQIRWLRKRLPVAI